MAFQPFGYRFELLSTMPVAEARASLRAKRRSWFDAKSGPRGWVIGPIFCFWLSAFDRHGPMVFGLCTEHARGTRVRGLAGSDLNGVLMIPLMAFLVYQMISEGSASLRQLLVIAAIFLVGGPLLYWFAHKDRRQAEPLIAFIEDALGKVRPKARRRPLSDTNAPIPMRLLVCENGPAGPTATADAVYSAIETIRYDPNGFVILQRDDQRFMQTAAKDGGFILERRDGGEARHFVAQKSDGTGNLLSPEEITEALLDYLVGRSTTTGIRWEPLQL